MLQQHKQQNVLNDYMYHELNFKFFLYLFIIRIKDGKISADDKNIQHQHSSTNHLHINESWILNL